MKQRTQTVCGLSNVIAHEKKNVKLQVDDYHALFHSLINLFHSDTTNAAF
jgi:hypothetical protein